MLADKYGQDQSENRPVIGVGTVLDEVTARLAILEGAEFVVSPAFSPDVVKLCHRYRVPVMPGVVTIAEAQAALESGADVVKLFPGSMFTPTIIKTLKGTAAAAEHHADGRRESGQYRRMVQGRCVRSRDRFGSDERGGEDRELRADQRTCKGLHRSSRTIFAKPIKFSQKNADISPQMIYNIK